MVQTGPCTRYRSISFWMFAYYEINVCTFMILSSLNKDSWKSYLKNCHLRRKIVLRFYFISSWHEPLLYAGCLPLSFLIRNVILLVWTERLAPSPLRHKNENTTFLHWKKIPVFMYQKKKLYKKKQKEFNYFLWIYLGCFSFFLEWNLNLVNKTLFFPDKLRNHQIILE